MFDKLIQPVYLRVFLILVALHSFIVGLNLIFFPPEWMVNFGFNTITENFFKVQGGVFHLVMVVAYTMAAKNPRECKSLIKFSIITKFIATVFLFMYFLLIPSNETILLSGLGDLLMGLILLLLYSKADLSPEAESQRG